MIFTVTSLPQADDQLMEIWLASMNRRSVTEALNRIERDLRRDAHLKGQPIDGLRVIVDKPLALIFSVSVDDRLVTILWIQESDFKVNH